MSRYRQNYEVPTTRSPWPVRLAGSALIVLLLVLLVMGMLKAEEQEQAASMAGAEGAAFEAGRLTAREDLAQVVAEAYEQGRRDALAEAQRDGAQR